MSVTSPSVSRLDALGRISALLREGLPARELLQRLLPALPEVISADAYAIWRYDGRAHEWMVLASIGLSREYISHPGGEKREKSLLADGPFGVSDVFASPLVAERRAFYDDEGIRSMFVIPLHLRGEPGGTLVCYFRNPYDATELDRELGRILGDVVSAGLSATGFESFAEAARMVSGELNLENIVQSVTDAATRMTNAQFGAFFYNVVDHSGESYTLYTISGVPREAFSRFPMPRNTKVFAPTFSGTNTVPAATRATARTARTSGCPRGISRWSATSPSR